MAIELQWSDMFTTIFKFGHGHGREVAHHLRGLKLTCVFDRFLCHYRYADMNQPARLLDMFASLCVIQPFPFVILTIFLHPRMGRASNRETKSAYKGPQLTW